MNIPASRYGFIERLTRPGALTIRISRRAPGRSPAAAAVRVTERSTIRELLRVAAGKPVAA